MKEEIDLPLLGAQSCSAEFDVETEYYSCDMAIITFFFYTSNTYCLEDAYDHSSHIVHEYEEERSGMERESLPLYCI